MNLDHVMPGDKAPYEFNVIIEIPMNAEPVKYEVDKKTGAMFVDRFMSTAMRYPCNYGYIPHTLSDDGDPADVLVLSPFALITGIVVTCRAIGVLEMEDEAGGDEKLLAVPINKISSLYEPVQQPEDLHPMITAQIAHFFEHYKDLEVNKWVKIKGWSKADRAQQLINDAISRFQQAADKPMF